MLLTNQKYSFACRNAVPTPQGVAPRLLGRHHRAPILPSHLHLTDLPVQAEVFVSFSMLDPGEPAN
jgi:hypothetical protein